MEPPATSGSVGGTARVSRVLTATQVTLSALALIPVTSGVVSRYLALTPYRAVAWGRIWMLFTCALFDRQLLPAVLNLPLFALAARPVELAFGTPAYCLFLAAVSLTAALSVACLSLGTYAILKISSLIFMPLATVGGLNLALLVALKQHIPEHEVGFAAAKMRMNYAPLAYIAALLVLTLLGQFNPAGLFFSLICFHSSWMYLRYFKTNDLNGVRGDASEAFAFATLFPDPVRPFVAVAGTVLHLFCKPVINLLLSSGGEAPTANGTAKPDLVSSIAQERTTSLDSERRRQRAMKALDERLAGSQSDSAV